MKTIDITKYGRPHPADLNDIYYVDAEHGKEVAEAIGLLEEVKTGTVDITIKRKKDDYRGVVPSESFIKGFIGPTAREIGIDEFAKRVRICGEKLDLGSYYGYSFEGCVSSYLRSEKKRLAREAKKKAREEQGNVWTAPLQFLIPEIGTVIKLTEDWTFRLHYEYRNDSIMKMLGEAYKWKSWNDHGKNMGDITIKAGSILTVDRIYIRKGVGDYSSITFYLNQKSEIVCENNTMSSKGRVRFWAKLADVNKMKVVIDTNTLANN